MGGHKKAGAAVKYGTQSEAGPPTHREPYLEIQNATDLFHHHQSDAEAKTQIIQMLEGLAYNVIGGLVIRLNKTHIIQILDPDS